jgi:hypothetical protein
MQKNSIYLIISALSIFLTINKALYAQIIKEKDVPAAVINTHKTKFANAKNLKWEYKKDKKIYVVDCINENYNTEVTYAQNGKWIKTEKEINEQELPKAITESYLKSKYAQGSISKIKEVSRNDSKEKEYKLKVESGSLKYQLKYASSGKLLKAEEKNKKQVK